MDIILMSNENSIGQFVSNLHDLSTIFEFITPSSTAFLENALIETEFSEKIKNMNCPVGKQ